MPDALERRGLRARLCGTVATILGIGLALTPVLLWVAWTAAQIACIALAAAVSAALLALFEESSEPGAPHQAGPADAGSRNILPEEFIEEVQRLYPLTYHHSRLETRRFRQAMKRLSALIEGSGSGDPMR